MRPFILNFKEISNSDNLDFSTIEYDHVLNLNICVKRKLPAINFINLATETFTRIQGESSDSDQNNLNKLLDTSTKTLSGGEDSDRDRDISTMLNISGINL